MAEQSKKSQGRSPPSKKVATPKITWKKNVKQFFYDSVDSASTFKPKDYNKFK